MWASNACVTAEKTSRQYAMMGDYDEMALDAGQIEVVDDAVADILRRKTIAQRVEMVFECNETMRMVIEGAIRTFHPEWNDIQVRAEVARRMTREST